jgi:hypothetical protein
LVIITLTLDATRAESATGERARAKAEAIDARVQIEEALAQSPLFYYNEVHALERARVCTQGDGRVVEPGNPWPRECGSVWGYQAAAARGDVRIEIIPGSLDEASTVIKIMASAGRSEYGIEVHYRLDSLARYSLYSSGDLNLTALPGGTNVLGGETYSGGGMDLPDGTVTVNDAVFVAEEGYTQHPDLSSIAGEEARFYAGVADTSGSIQVRDSAELYNNEPGVSGTQAMFAGAVDVACPGTTAAVVNGRSTHLCLQAGADIAGIGGTTASIPAETVAYLLIFSAGGAETVEVYASSLSSTAPQTCGGGCNLAASSAGSIAAGRHPGALSYWTKVTTAPLPNSGIIAGDRDIHIGLCGENFVGSGGSCTDWDGSGGMRVERNVTVLSGSLTNPSNIYLSGPISVADGVSFGGVAAGRLYIPYWARSVGSDLEIQGAYSGLGLGGTGTSVSTLPENVGAGASRFGRLVLTGGVAGVGVDTGFELFDEVSITGRGRHWRNPPVLYPAMNGNWMISYMRYLPSIEVCGEVVCENW